MDRESSIALCHGGGVIKRIGLGPRERCRSVPLGGVRKKKRMIGRRPGEQCRSVPRSGVKEGKKMIGRGPRERCVSFPRFAI